MVPPVSFLSKAVTIELLLMFLIPLAGRVLVFEIKIISPPVNKSKLVKVLLLILWLRWVPALEIKVISPYPNPGIKCPKLLKSLLLIFNVDVVLAVVMSR